MATNQRGIDIEERNETAVVTFSERLETTLTLSRDCNVSFGGISFNNSDGVFQFKVYVNNVRLKAGKMGRCANPGNKYPL